MSLLVAVLWLLVGSASQRTLDDPRGVRDVRGVPDLIPGRRTHRLRPRARRSSAACRMRIARPTGSREGVKDFLWGVVALPD